MSGKISEPQSSWRERSPLGLLLKLIHWAVVVALTLVLGYIAVGIVAILTVLAATSLSAASFSENVTTKYWVLFVWTVTALLLASFAKFFVLLRARDQHNLRWCEYIDHTITTGVLSGGLTFGAVTVMIAAFWTVGSDIEAISETDNEARANFALLALFPLFIAVGAVWFTVNRYIAEIPESKPLDKGTERMIRRFHVLRGWANHLVFRRIRKLFSRTEDRVS